MNKVGSDTSTRAESTALSRLPSLSEGDRRIKIFHKRKWRERCYESEDVDARDVRADDGGKLRIAPGLQRIPIALNKSIDTYIHRDMHGCESQQLRQSERESRSTRRRQRGEGEVGMSRARDPYRSSLRT